MRSMTAWRDIHSCFSPLMICPVAIRIAARNPPFWSSLYFVEVTIKMLSVSIYNPHTSGSICWNAPYIMGIQVLYDDHLPEQNHLHA